MNARKSKNKYGRNYENTKYYIKEGAAETGYTPEECPKEKIIDLIGERLRNIDKDEVLYRNSDEYLRLMGEAIYNSK